jgi:SAM-dependent methyltransferase
MQGTMCKERFTVRRCPLCDAVPEPAGSRRSALSGQRFDYGVCPSCGLGLVLNPREDYAALYDRGYYEGHGFDETVDYLYEMEDPGIRALEWQGLAEGLGPVDPERRILDFGAGLGGLVVRLREAGWQAWGYEGEGFAHDYMREHSIPCLDELPASPSFDTVFAVEVFEHLVEPVPVLRSILAALVPGGRLIITTGNFARARQPLASWTYASVPDVHVTFWTPSAWARALHLAGFEADEQHPPLSPAVTQYKILKSLPRPAHRLAAVAPAWRPLAGRVDRHYGVSEFAVGLAPVEDSLPPDIDYLSTIAPPAGLTEIPPFDLGWQSPEGPLSHLTYVGGAGWAWSDDLEELHEESSRDHFIDVLTRDSLTGAVPAEAAVVADLGCSTGYLLEDLRRVRPTAQLVGVDVVGAGLVKAHEAVPEAALLLADVCDLPLPDDGLDAAVSANMLEHVEDDVSALREVHRILRPGGTAAFVVPFGAKLLDYYDGFLGHHRRYGRNELAGKAEAVGFEIVRVDHLGQLLYPAFWLVKKRNRLTRDGLQGEALQRQVQQDIDATSNSRLGELACAWERSMVRKGVGLGAGIRELVVVRKPARAGSQ